MQTFKWTIPDPGYSDAERDSHRAYWKKRRSREEPHVIKLTQCELKFIEKWGKERLLGRKAFNRKILKKTCLVMMLFSSGYLCLKLLGVIDEGASLYTSALFIALVSNFATTIPSWKRNKERFLKLNRDQPKTQQ